MKKTPTQTAFDRFSEPTIVETPKGTHSNKHADKVTETWIKTCLYINPDIYMTLKVYCTRHRMSFTKLVDKGLHLVIKNDENLKKAWTAEQQKE